MWQLGREPNLQAPHAVTWFPMAAGTIVMYTGGWRPISAAATRLSRGMSTPVIEGESHSFGCEASCCPSYPLLAGLWCRGTSDSSATTMCAGAGGSAQVPGELGLWVASLSHSAFPKCVNAPTCRCTAGWIFQPPLCWTEEPLLGYKCPISCRLKGR